MTGEVGTWRVARSRHAPRARPSGWQWQLRAHLEIKVDGVGRTHRDERGTAVEAARSRLPDVHDGSQVPFDCPQRLH